MIVLGLIVNKVGVERTSMEAGWQALMVHFARIGSRVRVTESEGTAETRTHQGERSCGDCFGIATEKQGCEWAIRSAGFRKHYDSGKMRNMFKSIFSCACGLALQNKEDAHHVQHAHAFLRSDGVGLNCQTGRSSDFLAPEILENRGF